MNGIFRSRSEESIHNPNKIVQLSDAKKYNSEFALHTEELHYYADDKEILSGVNVSFKRNAVTAIIGPSGSGKTTLLRTLNRMNESMPGTSLNGGVYFDGVDVKEINDCQLRTDIGIVFQKPTVFSKSIYENVIFGLKYKSKKSRSEYDHIVEAKLKCVQLWDEVKDRLEDSASSLSIGQQQRLCIARTLALEPKVVLMDEPTSALDPKSTEAIQKLIRSMSKNHTVIFVTHNLSMAKKIGDYVVFICNGRVCETGKINDFFTNPCSEESREYINVI